MGALSSDSDQKVSADDGESAANEGVSIFFGRSSIESVKSSAGKRCNSIPNQYPGDLNNAPSSGSVARKAAFFDQYIRTISLEKEKAATDDNLQDIGEPDVARSLDFCSARKEPQEAQSKEKEEVLPVSTCGNNQVEAASARDLPHSKGDSLEESHTDETSGSEVLEKVEHTFTLNDSIDTQRLIDSKKLKRSSGQLENPGNEGREVTGPDGKDTITQKSETVKATECAPVNISGVRKETPKGASGTNLRRIAHDPNHALEVASELTKVCSNGTPFSLTTDKRSQSKSKSRNGLTSGACMGAKTKVTSTVPKEQATKRNVKSSKNVEAKDERAPTNMSSKAKGAKLNDGTGFRFKSDERAEKRKEFNLRIEEKQSAKEAENTKIRAKTQEELDADIRELRRALAFKAKPMPNFYQADVRRVPATRAKSPKLEKACNSSDSHGHAANGQSTVAECKQEKNTNFFTSPGITGNCIGESDEERSCKIPAKAKIHKPGLQNGALRKVASTSAENSIGKSRGKKLQAANNKPSTATAKRGAAARASSKPAHAPDSAIAGS